MFDSGTAELDDWLRRRALANELAGASRTFVVCEGDRVAGYYSLSAFCLERSAVGGRVRRNMPEPIPAVLLGRLAVDRRDQGAGLGSALLADAMRRTEAVAGQLGVRVLAVQAIDDAAKRFYEHRGFEPTRTDPMLLVVLVADITAGLRGDSASPS